MEICLFRSSICKCFADKSILKVGKKLFKYHQKNRQACTVKPLYEDRPWDRIILIAFVDSWSLLRGHLYCSAIWYLEMVVVIDMWLLFGVGS